MGRFCAVPNCGKIRGKTSCHRLPFNSPERLKLWLDFLGLDVSTPVEDLQKVDHRVCGLHFTNEDFAGGRNKSSKKVFRLRNTAVPTLRPGTTELEELGGDQSSWERTSVGGQCDFQQTLVTEDSGQCRSTPPLTQSKEARRNSSVMQERNALMSDIVVRLTCLLQLFQKCLKCCSDACSISTRRKGPIIHVVQQCWSCGNTRDWTNQPPPNLLLPYPIVSPEVKEEPAVTFEDMDEITVKIEEEEEAEMEGEAREVEEEDEQEEDEAEEEEDEMEEEAGEMEEEEKEVEEEDEVTDEEGEEENQKPKKRRDSDGEWAPNDEAVMETSDEESEGSDEESEGSDEESEGSDEEDDDEEESPHPWTWCCDCEVKASADCFRQNHLQVYCCVQCGYVDGYQEPKNTELQETSKISPEAQSAGHQEGTGDVTQAAKGLCSPEDYGNNKPTYSYCPEDPNSFTSQGVITVASHTTNSGIEEPFNSCVDASSCSNSGTTQDHDYGVCTRRKWRSRSDPEGIVDQRGPQNESPEDTSNSNYGMSDLGSKNNHQQEASAAKQDRQKIPIYAVYFKDPHSLQRHMKRSHGGKRELCPDCGKCLYRRDGRSVHVCNHKVKPFICLTCGRRFTSEARLQLHIQFHSEDYRTSCRYCYETFKQKDKQRHEETHNGENLKFRCPECPKRFATVNTRKAHLSTAHFNRGRFVCKVCDKGFHIEFKLKRHEVVHTGLKAYSCKLCDRSFNQPGHLKSHMRVHTGERPFMCHECGLCFNHNVSLKNHVQRKHRSASDSDDGYREEVWDDFITGTQSDGQKK